MVRYKFTTSPNCALFMLVAIFTLYLTSCSGEPEEFVPEVGDIEVRFDTIRYEEALASIDTSTIKEDYLSLASRFPAFTDLYFNNIVPIRRQTKKDTAAFYNELQQFLTAPSVRALTDSVRLSYPDLVGIYKEFAQAFRYYIHYFPEATAPDLYTFISEFGYGAFIFLDEEGNDAIGLGLDLFLGDRIDYSQLAAFNSAFSQYLTRTFNREHLVKKGLDPLIADLAGSPGGNRFIDYIVLEGKKQYLLDKFLPHTPDSIKWEYTAEQMQWVEDNEWNIWAFIVDEELLYSTEQHVFLKLIRPAPSSQGMPPESPGRAVNYIGYQIVRAYMDKFPDTSMEELMALRDGQEMLELAKYRPAVQ